MSGSSVAAAGALVIAAVLLAIGRSAPRRRLLRISRHRRTTGRPRVDRASLLRHGTPLLAGLATAGLLSGWVGVVAGVLVGLATWRVVRRLPSPELGRERAVAAAELPYAIDLLAAVLRSGAPLDRAVTVVGAAIDGPLGRRFTEVGRALRLGVTGGAGWQALTDVVGADGFVPAAVRAADSGAALAATCVRCAADLRERREARAEAAAQRAGVLLVLPLGFCFLPAFVLVGVIPILLGVLDDVLS
ncbi:type II secretion system F family protein [Cryptosporangium aurantiacum]|uniref:Flp pilus assembly protein TadB n=1 Tax=Cryptosporangium aurantiacum TaxID=134849 RepID=A0A1M7NHN3_9ACTN|nr:type II secretion system F family protein [Cryptosporangium aurantiacum]SHN02749.1 Flp pilus assembly protein TadB [Cryptosporangium aurantiacum]